MGYEWVAPTITGTFAVALAVLAFVTNKRTKRAEADAEREPTVGEAWLEADRQRRLRAIIEDMFYTLRGAFKGYVRRMQAKYGEEPAALNTKEQEILDREPPVK